MAKVDNIIDKHKQLQKYYLSSATSYELLDNGNLIHKEDKDFFKKVIDFIEQNIENEDLSVPLICDKIGISKMTFYRKTRKILNLTPSDFIKNIKLNRAIVLLKTTNFTVQEVIFRCGFNNLQLACLYTFLKHNIKENEHKTNSTDIDSANSHLL